MMDFPWLEGLSKPMSALIGAAFFGGVAVIGGTLMLIILDNTNLKQTAVSKAIFSKVSPRVFYFGITAPVWALVGAAFGYELGGIE